MRDPFVSLRRLFAELKRRNVYRVAAAYAVVGFVLLQAADLVFPALNLPPWAYSLVVILVLFGFPVALVIAWAFELSPEGVTRTPDADVEPGRTKPAHGGLSGWIVVLGIVVIVVLAGGGTWYLATVNDGESRRTTAAVTDSVGGAAADAARRASRDRPFVAVLPLENLSPEEDNAFFAAGIHEEIIGQLSKVSGLGVFARTTMRQYADTDQSVHEIGRELDARAVLEGSVRRAGDRVRITTQLIDPHSRDHLWSETYEREVSPEQIFEIQADIAGHVTSALETELTEEERQRIADAPTSDLAAYDAYLQGRNAAMDAWNLLDPGPIDSAVEHLREALRRDSTFAEAHAWLGFAYGTRGFFSNQERWADSALVAIDHALALAPELPEVHAIRGLHYQIDSVQAAEQAYRRALLLDPNNWLAADGMADLAVLEGDYAEAVRWAHRVLRVDPRREWALAYMGELFGMIGMQDEAADWFHYVRDEHPENALAVWGLTELYLSRGQVERAHETVESYRARRPDHPIGLRLAGEIALHRGEPERAIRFLEGIARVERPIEASTLPGERRMLLGLARQRSGDHEAGRGLLREGVDSLRVRLDQGNSWAVRSNHLWLARGLAALSQDDEALEHLRGAMERGVIYQQVLRSDPFFEGLWSDPRFEEILRQMRAKQQRFREQVRGMGLDLYPPGAEPESTGR